jgi:L-gulonolactone oxidase
VATGAREWRNWAGDQRCRPASTSAPSSREELAEVVGVAAERGRVRASASGHSFTDIALTDATMIRLDRLDRVLESDPDGGRVRVEAGIVLSELNRRLDELGVAFENLGDIDRQSIAGSISTATHGTGTRFQNVSAQIDGVELVLADGSSAELTAESDPEGLRAARVGLGALGIVYALTLRTVPAYTISRVDRRRPLDEVLAGIDEIADGHDHFEFYVFPFTDVALCRESRRTDDPPQPSSRAGVFLQEVVLENWVGSAFATLARYRPSLAPRLSRFAAAHVGDAHKVDRSFRVFASDRRTRFTEMEYGIPREHAAEAVRRVLDVVSSPGLGIAFPIEVRFVAADDAYLSPSHERETCYVAVHSDHRRPAIWNRYFREVERIMRDYDGRPHWGKRHFRTAADLAPAYPRWEDFQAVRRRLDPGGVFGNAYTDRVLGAGH